MVIASIPDKGVVTVTAHQVFDTAQYVYTFSRVLRAGRSQVDSVVACAKYCRVVAIAALKEIVAHTTDEGIVARTSIQEIVARTTIKLVIASIPEKAVVAGAAH